MILFSMNCFSQNSIPNGNMESIWIGYDDTPNMFLYSSNLNANFRGCHFPVNCVMYEDSNTGNRSLYLQTQICGDDTIVGYVFSNNPNGCLFQEWPGGFPYSELPIGIEGKYKSLLNLGDTAYVYSIFKKNGLVLGVYKTPLMGINTNFTSFNMVFNPPLTTTPDTMIFAATSCKFSREGARDLDWVMIDSVRYTGVSSNPQYFTGDFSSWQTTDHNIPSNWKYEFSETSEGVYITYDKYKGNFAALLITRKALDNNNNCYAKNTVMQTGEFNTTNNTWEGGNPFSNLIDTLDFFYKYFPNNLNDSAIVNIIFKVNGNSFQEIKTKLPASTFYTNKQIPFNLGIQPDSVIIQIMSSKPENIDNSYVQSALKIDEVHFKSQPLATSIAETFIDDLIETFPIPCLDKLNINAKSKNLKIAFQDILGETLFTQNLSIGMNEINVTQLNNGIYFLHLEFENKIYTQKVIVLH